LEQLGFERVIRLSFQARDEMGFHYIVRLYAEIMGKYSNLILTDENDKVLGAVKPVDFTTSQKRQVLPGMQYEMPPAQEKIDPSSETRENFLSLRLGDSKAADKFLTTHYLGLSTLSAREIAHRAKNDSDEALWEAFSAFMSDISAGRVIPTLALDDGGKPREYAFCDLCQYEGIYSIRHPETVSEVIEAYFLSRDNTDRVHQRAADLFRLLQNQQNRLEKKIALQEGELAETARKETYQKYGELITANIYRLSRGMKVARVEDYYSEDYETIEIPLDVRLTPAQNAQAYYKKYTKLRNAEVELQKQIAAAKEELTYILSVLDTLSRASGQTELDEIRMELQSAGYGSRMKKNAFKGGTKKSSTKPIEYTTSGGYRLLCGRNNLQNDEISLKIASRSDWWFHVKNAPGSHVVMFANGEEPSERDFTEAAMVAAYNSSLSEAKHIAVDYTQVRNLKKPAGAKPGFVIYHTNYSAYVTPDREVVERLKKSEK
jgi:predicted ribosome quality control (RQC) complex YloA/Tae2 family protein